MANSVDIRGGRANFAHTLGSQSQFAQRVKAAAGKKMAPRLQAVADDAVRRAEQAVNTLYQKRPSDRRGSAGGRHLAGSFRAELRGSPGSGGYDTFPFTIVLISDADPEKVHALNYGARPHVITARNVKYLSFPYGGLYQSQAFGRVSKSGVRRLPVRAAPGQRLSRPQRFSPSPGAGRQASGRGSWVRRQSVQHPGIVPSYFMELALERAVESALRKQVRLPR